jgi:hypothetical protein
MDQILQMVVDRRQGLRYGSIAAMDLEFGDAVWVTHADGTEELAHFLAGPWAHQGCQAIWVGDNYEWTNATVHFGRGPEGTPHPPENVRPAR